MSAGAIFHALMQHVPEAEKEVMPRQGRDKKTWYGLTAKGLDDAEAAASTSTPEGLSSQKRGREQHTRNEQRKRARELRAEGHDSCPTCLRALDVAQPDEPALWAEGAPCTCEHHRTQRAPA